MEGPNFNEQAIEYCRLSLEIANLRADKKWIETQYALWAAQREHMTFIQTHVERQTKAMERIANAIEDIVNEEEKN